MQNCICGSKRVNGHCSYFFKLQSKPCSPTYLAPKHFYVKPLATQQLLMGLSSPHSCSQKGQTESRYIAVLKAACNVINMPHDIKKSLLVNTFSNKPNKVYATFLCVLTAALVYIMKPFGPHFCLGYLEEIQKLLCPQMPHKRIRHIPSEYNSLAKLYRGLAVVHIVTSFFNGL